MSTDAKLDKILAQLEIVIEQNQDLEEQVQELRDAIADRSLPGSGFGIEEYEDE